ncbi:uncharacterized protein B0P05DRAFT_523921 [Gilbertella persicaria]|uniref:uncharacterized protein n=1 Tax=Gilbertella persicaria TaxID=101096 RepID=UPI002220A684|nr:uncharacterized protein B0P05DRAFT_523921 [Gilbertella persicaria]KAI8094922.1 hypothetical protein B0P05DRAFT_523921 [Gilbertella persicaria]
MSSIEMTDTKCKRPIHNYNDNIPALLLDLSSNKKYLVYVTENMPDDEEEVSELEVPREGLFDSVYGDRVSYSLTIRNLKDVDLAAVSLHLTERIYIWLPEDNNLSMVYFLSVSNDGRFISLSCLANDPTKVACIIFEVNTAINQRKKLGLQGRGIFLDNGQFVLVNLEYLYVFDQDFELVKRFPITCLIGKTLGKFASNNLPSFAATYEKNQFSKKCFSIDAQTLLCISGCIKQGVLMFLNPCSFHGYIAYAIGQDLSVISKSPMQILGFSENLDFSVCHVGNELHLINNIKGCVTQKLPFPIGPEEFLITQLEFSLNGKHLNLAGISTYKDKRSSCFRVWDIMHQRLIYSMDKPLNPNMSYEVPIDHHIPPFLVTKLHPEQTCAVAEQTIVAFHTTVSYIESLKFSWFTAEMKTKVPMVYMPQESYFAKKKRSSNNLHNIIQEAFNRETERLNHTCRRSFPNMVPFALQMVWFDHLYYFMEVNGNRYCLILREDSIEFWAQKDASQACGEGHNFRQEIYHGYELVYTRCFGYGCAETGFLYKQEWSIKDYTCSVRSKSLHSLKETQNVIQLIQERIDGRLIVRLKLEQKGTDAIRVEDIYLPFTETSLQDDQLDSPHRHSHQLEGTCQALLSYAQNESTGKVFFGSLRRILQEKTNALLHASLENMKKNQSHYFATMSGNNILSLLASFETGRRVLFKIVQIKELPICIYSHPKYTSSESSGESDERENALTILIENMSYGLYKLLLNKIIQDAYKLGSYTLSLPVMEALYLLQKSGYKELLSKTIRDLDFIPVADFNLAGCIKPGFKSKFDLTTEQELIVDKNTYRNSWTTIEQVKPEDLEYEWLFKILFFWKTKYVSRWRTQEERKHALTEDAMLKGSYIKPCIIPLLYLNTYLTLRSEMGFSSRHSVLPKNSSSFIKMATDQSRHNIFDEGNLMIAVLLLYKWNEFIFIRFLLAYLVHLVFYLTYFLVVPFSIGRFGFVPGESSIWENGQHLACTIVLFVCGVILVVQEFRQWFSLRSNYVWSVYNYIDISVLILSLATFIQLVYGLSYLDEVSSICSLLIWLHGLLRLRAIQPFGVALESIIQLFYTVLQIILIMVTVVIAFAFAFVILLQRKTDSYFEEQYTGTMTLPNATSENATTVSVVDSGSNDFTDAFKAFRDVWFFIYGIWDPINSGDASDNVMSIILAILFSFFVLLLFSNIVIGFMSASIEDVIKRGRRVWLNHLREIVAEIELLWCLKFEKRNRRNNPAFIYYAATDDEIRSQRVKMEEESERLVKDLEEAYAEDSLSQL